MAAASANRARPTGDRPCAEVPIARPCGPRANAGNTPGVLRATPAAFVSPAGDQIALEAALSRSTTRLASSPAARAGVSARAAPRCAGGMPAASASGANGSDGSVDRTGGTESATGAATLGTWTMGACMLGSSPAAGGAGGGATAGAAVATGSGAVGVSTGTGCSTGWTTGCTTGCATGWATGSVTGWGTRGGARAGAGIGAGAGARIGAGAGAGIGAGAGADTGAGGASTGRNASGSR